MIDAKIIQSVFQEKDVRELVPGDVFTIRSPDTPGLPDAPVYLVSSGESGLVYVGLNVETPETWLLESSGLAGNIYLMRATVILSPMIEGYQ